MDEYSAFEGVWRATDPQVGSVTLQVRRDAAVFVVRRFGSDGVPFGLPVTAIPEDGRLVARDIADGEAATLVFALTPAGSIIEVWMDRSAGALEFKRMSPDTSG